MSVGSIMGSARRVLRGMWREESTAPPFRPRHPLIEVLPLGRTEPRVRALPLSTDAPRTLALRRIHVVNRGAGTLLRDWEVWTAGPGQGGTSVARVMSPEEWALMSRGLLLPGDVPVLCRGDVLHAPTNRRIKRDIPFIAEGLLPDEVRPGYIFVSVHFRDRDNHPWHYADDVDQSV